MQRRWLRVTTPTAFAFQPATSSLVRVSSPIFTLADLNGVLSPTRRCHLNHESIMVTRNYFHAGLVGTPVTRPPSTMNSLPVE